MVGMRIRRGIGKGVSGIVGILRCGVARAEAVTIVLLRGLETQVSLHGLVALGALLRPILSLTPTHTLIFVKRLLDSRTALELELILVVYDLRLLAIIRDPWVFHNFVQLNSFPRILGNITKLINKNNNGY